MIAKIIPLKRLPKHIDILDYTIPKTLEGSLKVGQLITIPFRTSNIFGLVLSIEKNRIIQKKLKDIIDIVIQEPLLEKPHIHFLRTISSWYGTPLGATIKMGLPPLQKRKSKEIVIQQKEKTIDKNITQKPTYHLYTNEEHHKKIIETITKGSTLFIVPEKHDIKEIKKLIPTERKNDIIVWHSTLSTKQKFERWMTIKNTKHPILIGTRGTMFLPIENLENIILDKEHSEHHKHWDQAPRFHTKDVATLLSSIYQSNVHLMSFSKSAESYFHIHKGTYEEQPQKNNTQKQQPTLLSMADERRGRNFGVFANASEELITTAKEDIFVLVNRRGFATIAGCNACGFHETCNTCEQPYVFHEKTNKLHCHYCQTKKDLHKTCPTCHAPISQLKGAGTEFVEKEVQKLHTNRNTHHIVRIDGDTLKIHLEKDNKPRIIIGTKKAIPYVRFTQTTGIIITDIDKQLSMPEYLAQEQAWHTIQTLNYKRREDSAYYIQTWNKRHIVLRGIKENDRWYRTDLSARKKLSYPPYTYLVRYFYGDEVEQSSKKEAVKVYNKLKIALTTHQKDSTITAPIAMHPKYMRKKYWYMITVKLPITSWQKDLPWINTHIPQHWKIDPNPISFLSP
ncbi:MAG: primosomal protein N' [Candidatus Magasanikbacteria bacterium]|jgi:primosomal protein N' (replication factor Y) (superfamily II helicase)|nr:primosomal protein N' [Candidatus Magasanikbacteria bacterium]MBT4221389.1 primosomal protein N' [Candidatus Magasanikbacteria bacterium]MBT4350763.1 primosomal protein N' [Candidatus Magasanikbacteria bacterium]MBT4541561.1 primosomal protein N' [Candidatus Magasanikbacteria bacterium]MBT6253513.1 primosomal protein N' [Candidatus Magasanikbacteria bacterium]